MMAEQGQEGAWLFENRISSETTPRAYFNLEWLLFGRMAAWTGVSLVSMFHIWRIFGVFLFIMCANFLIGLCLPDNRYRILCLLLLIFGSGFGWMLASINYFLGAHLAVTSDFYGVTLFAHLVNKPHFIRGAIFAMLTCAFLIQGEKSGKYRYFVYSGLAASAHGFIRPFHIPETYLLYVTVPMILCYFEGQINRQRFLNYALAGLVFLPTTIYLLLTAYWNVLGMAGWQGFSHHLLTMMLWLGFPFCICIFALCWGGLSMLRKQDVSTLILSLWLLAAWLVANAFPYYSPGAESSFYALAIAPPILIFCGLYQFGLRFFVTHYPRLNTWTAGRRGMALAILFLVFSVPSNAYNYYDFFAGLHEVRDYVRHYIDNDEYNALVWMRGNTNPDDVMLASVQVAQFAPRLSGNRVFAGHEHYTPNFTEKTQQLYRFYGQSNDAEYKQGLVTLFHIDYLFYGPFERKIGQLNPKGIPWLVKVYDQGEVQIYRVKHEALN
jgi:hypothetical protein